MAEAVRLIVCDMDDTFWGATLSEGGVAWRDETRAIVVELARRGIMRWICSKNDFEAVRTVLVDLGVWDYFIFPCIDRWPKSPRIDQIIKAVQLRLQTVMLIDDNHFNLEEAKFYVSEVQVASEAIIPTILSDPLFTGKDDRALTRLNQYKVLERRKASEAREREDGGGDNISLFRSSDIRVRIENDVGANLDRAIEQINHTNRLNFIMRRQSEDIDLARERLRKDLSDWASSIN